MFARGATSLMRSITSFAEGNFIYGKAVTSFICAAHGGNDVDLRSNDVACKHANDVVPCGTNEKIQVIRLGFFALNVIKGQKSR